MKFTAGIIALLTVAPQVSGALTAKHGEESCAAQDLAHRVQVQNKLAGVCESMCKEVHAYPQCTCPDFVEPDSTPGVMTWDELLAYMDQLADWGRDSIKGWHKQAAQLQVSGALSVKHGENACASQDLARRVQLQNKLAGICESMCKEVHAYPKCTCPDFVEPDSTPGVMTWDELLTYMDQLEVWGRDSIKGWHKQASQLQVAQANSTGGTGAVAQANSTGGKGAAPSFSVDDHHEAPAPAPAAPTCTATVVSAAAVSLADGGMPHMVYDKVEFCGEGQLKSAEGSCPYQQAFDEGNGTLTSNGGMSDCKMVECAGYPCCMAFKCGASGEVWAR